MKVMIARFEDSYAVVELQNLSIAVIPRQVIDAEAQVGDILEIRVDHTSTDAKQHNPLDFLDRPV